MAGTSSSIALAELREEDPRIAGLPLPRTRTYLALRSLGLPLLDGWLVLSDAGLEAAAEGMHRYGAAIVRSDPMRRDAPTLRGGDVWALDHLAECAAKYLPHGRALLLLEPYERSANHWSFAIAGGLPSHTFAFEIVGPGFDVAHLNRGRLRPHETFSGELIPGLRPAVTRHDPFDVVRYQQDLEREHRATPRETPRGMPPEYVSAALNYFRRVAEKEDAEFVLTGAVLSPGNRMVFWDLFRADQANR